jgi:hypothetical protein
MSPKRNAIQLAFDNFSEAEIAFEKSRGQRTTIVAPIIAEPMSSTTNVTIANKKPWDRQDGEPMHWYRRFAELFIPQMGKHSLLMAINTERGRLGKLQTENVPQSWRRACNRWAWRSRAEAFDEEQANTQFHEWTLHEQDQRKIELARKILGLTPHEKNITLGGVYILRGKDGVYKIGCSHNLDSRTRELGAMLPFETQVVIKIPALQPHDLEKKLHRHFSNQRIRGEWFALTESDLHTIEQTYCNLVDI